MAKGKGGKAPANKAPVTKAKATPKDKAAPTPKVTMNPPPVVKPPAQAAAAAASTPARSAKAADEAPLPRLPDPGDMVRVLSPDGTLVAGAQRTMPDEAVLAVHDTMRLVRALDERMITLQRQGRAGFYGACTGEESTVLGTASALRATDWIVPALRQNSAMLLRGFKLTSYVGQVLGNSADELKARQMPSHHAALSVRQVSWSSCIANQLTQAVGLAKAMSVRGEDTVVAGYVGDGGTSEGDFHVALNFAATLKAPVVIVCQNNQWAISVPLTRQTLVTRIADKAVAYGMPGVRVDGNDLFAVYQVMTEAVARARAGQGPTLVEAYTYRVGAHSTSDDPSRYRDESITRAWKALDPLERLERYLVKQRLRSADEIVALTTRSIAQVDAAVREAEAMPPVAPETLIEDVCAEVPEALKRQWAEWGDLSRAAQAAAHS